MSIYLRHQVAALEHAASEIEIQVERQGPALRYEVRSLLKGLVSNAKNLADFAKNMPGSLKRGESCFDAESMNKVDSLARRIELVFRRAHRLIGRVQSFPGCRIEGQDPFHAEWKKLRAMAGLATESMMEPNEPADRGEARTRMYVDAWMEGLFPRVAANTPRSEKASILGKPRD